MQQSLLIVAEVVAGIWVLFAAIPFLRWPGVLRLPEVDEPAAAAPSLGSIAVVVPARNEAEMLPLTLPALVAQEPGSIWVVDDGSSDGTAEIAREILAGARGGVVQAPPRPRGWSGKVHAMATGVAHCAQQQPDVEWWLFTDADIHHRADSIRALAAQAGLGFDLVSVMARLRAQSGWERLVVPAFVFFFHMLYPFRLVVSGRIAAAAGGCVLVRRSSLERAGGLAALRDALIDDVALARVVRAAGGRLWLGLDAGIHSVRRYQSLGELWQMVARNAFVQLGYRWTLLLLVVAAMLLVFVAPPLLLAAGVVEVIRAGVPPSLESPAVVTVVAAALAWNLQIVLMMPYVWHHRAPTWVALCLPLSSLLYIGMTVSSAYNHLRGRTSSWRGRTYDDDPRRASLD